jgi:hypothetical protein
MIECINCGGPTEGRFRPVLGRGRMERLCLDCSDRLSILVQTAGETCVLHLDDPRFQHWLQSGRWPTRDGGSVGPEDVPAGLHANDCPCCAAFADEDE